MAIRVVCENEKEFDAALGSMIHCDATFSCPDDYLGRIVKCPGCQQPIRIGSSKRHVSTATGKPAADPKRINQTAIARQTQKVADSGKRKINGSSVQTSPKTDSSRKTKKKSKSSATTQKAESLNSKARHRPSSNGKATGTNPRKKTLKQKTSDSFITDCCPDCATPIPDGSNVCPACHLILQRPKGLGKKNFHIKHPVGMHLWLKDHAFAGVSMKAVKLTIHILLGLLLLISIAAGFIIFNLRTSGLVLLIGAVLTLPYLYMIYRCHIVCHDLSVGLAWWQKLFWNGVLLFARSRGWPHESDDTALHKRVILDLRKSPVDDHLLRTMKEIPQAAVLDLTGCSVTDQGVQVLHHLSHLQCLVLAGTEVSKEEIARLQMSLPRCWIWH